MIRQLRPLLLILLVAFPRQAHAQIVVYDPAAWFQRGTQILHDVDVVAHTKSTADQLTDMAKGLSGLGGFRIVPIVNTTWDTQAAMPPARIAQIENAAEIVAAMREGDAKRYLQNKLALIYVAARSQSHALKQSLAVQTDAGGPLTATINALMNTILSGNQADQQLVSVLQKIAIAGSVQHHQLDSLTQVSVGTVNQLGIMGQRQTNLDVEGLNTSLNTLELVEPVGESYTSGTAQAIRGWRSQ